MSKPRSCDTFVVLPPGTNGSVVFGKNSDRPSEEVQEVAYFPAENHDCPSTVKCTYIEVDQVPHSMAVVLSKPSWMWGAEMGANEHGVCIGNEAVWTKLNGPDDSKKRLLGMDLLRLGLERSTTALEALNVITALLEKYGQGGNCSNTMDDFTYHNSFLIADPEEAWILECPGKLWAAEKVSSSVRNISNELSIGTKIDLMHPDLIHYAVDKGFWNSERSPFNFKIAFGLDDDDDESYRYMCGKRMLTLLSSSGKFRETDMFKVLRDKSSGICMSSGSFLSTGSQVSVLQKAVAGPCCHWFTGTPDPCHSVFKPFVFVDDVEFPHQTVSSFNMQKDGFAEAASLSHDLYKAQEKFRTSRKTSNVKHKQVELESQLLSTVETMMKNFNASHSSVKDLFKNSVEQEISLYE